MYCIGTLPLTLGTYIGVSLRAPVSALIAPLGVALGPCPSSGDRPVAQPPAATKPCPHTRGGYAHLGELHAAGIRTDDAPTPIDLAPKEVAEEEGDSPPATPRYSSSSTHTSASVSSTSSGVGTAGDHLFDADRSDD